ncbi:type VII toxin-antitoxin system HepT family RNase toxin [Clostridium sp. WILCCON 0269]|uniref:Type VII toxin-antitoxin system HepT family RNase toxin n=1 Tax=Candidatus Clostridium eludens TaxID=3381663 RepID=A0ABW8SM38_9CLOT
MSDVILNKIAIIERCINRINEEYDNNPENLRNYTKQDSIILNIQRACEASIDLAMNIISERKLGIPQSSRDAFEFLFYNNIIDAKLASNLKSMLGFRNIAVHDYQTVNLDIVKEVIENHIYDLKKFATLMIER